MKKVNFIILMSVLILATAFMANAQEDSDLYEMDLESLMDIEIVSASKKAEDIFEAPLGATVLNGDQIKESGATSIMEALRLVPGVIVRETTPGNYDIHLRGYDGVDPKGLINQTANTMTLIMVNNRTVYSEFQGQTYWELLHINIEDVDRIEVVRGPVSAMYGPNAVAGVINILTKSPTKNKDFSANTYTMGGYRNSFITSTTASYNFGNGLGVKVSGNADMRDRHKMDYFIFSENKFVDELNEKTIRNTLGLPVLGADQPYNDINLSTYEPVPNYALHERYPYRNLATQRWGTNAHIRYNKNDLDVNLMSGYSSAKVQRIYANNNVGALTTDSLNNFFTHLWGSYKNLTFSADYNQGYNKVLGSGRVFTVESDILTIMSEYTYQVTDQFSLKPGASYKSSNYNSMVLGSTEQVIGDDFLTNGYQVVEPEDGGDLNNSVLSGHLQADFTWNDLRLIGAARVDKFKYPDKAVFSPLFSATYKITDDFLVRGSYGRSARTPFMYDLFFDTNLRYPTGMTNENNYEIYKSNKYRGTEKTDEIPGMGKTDYKLLKVDDAEIGFRHKISETFTLDIELFWSQLSDLITLNTVLHDTTLAYNETEQDSTLEITEYSSFMNLDMKPQQTGAMMSLTSVPFKNVSFQIYVMVQQTKINDYADSLDVDGNAIDTDGDGSSRYDFYHRATPAFTGGINMNYRPFDKLTINLNSYFYGHQYLMINNEKNYARTDANIILNATANYEVLDGMKLFVTGRNLIGGFKRQYAFADKIGPALMGGVNYEF